MVRALRRPRLELGAAVIGFVFPTYDSRAPRLLMEFVGRLERIEATYLFGVSTYGIAAGKALLRLRQAVQARGGRLSAGFALAMPHNGIGCAGVSEHRWATRIDRSRERIGEICATVAARRTGPIESGLVIGSFFRPEMLKMAPILFRFLARVLTGGPESLALTAGEACTGCGTCARICPVSNIEMGDGKPRWGDRCATCFACLHWCPVHAISLGGLDMGMRPYHHPDVTLADMLRQRESAG